MDEEQALLLNQAKIFINRNRFDKAENPLLQLLAREPSNQQAKSLLIICKAKQKMFQEAERLLKELKAAAPNSQDADFASAMLLSEQGKQKEAGEAFANAASASKTDASVHLRYSLFLNNIGKLPEALVEARKAAELDPRLEGAQTLIAEIEAALPKKEAEPLPEHGEIHNSWFYAKVPDGWSYSFHSEKNLHFFTDETQLGASVTIVPLTGSPAEITDLRGNFYSFVASDAGVKPARMRERRMAVGSASEIQVSLTEAGKKIRRIYLGYPYKDVFYVISSSFPEEAAQQCTEKFEYFANSFLPKGIGPSDVKAVAPGAAPPAPSTKDLAIHGAVALLGALIMLAGLYLLAQAATSGLFSGEKGAIVYLLMILLGFIPLSTLIFRFNPKLIYMLHLAYFFVLAFCAALGYLAISSGTLMLFDKSSALTGILAAIAGGAVLAFSAFSLLVVLAVFIYGRMKNKELEEAYPEAYSIVKAKLLKR